MEACKKFNYFCYVCGKYKNMPSRRKITTETSTLYESYFSLSVIYGKSWTPSIVCTHCIYHLNKWGKNGDAMPFGVPMIWRDPIVHVEDECYACINYTAGMNRRKMTYISYTETAYARFPLPHSDEIPVPDSHIPTEHIPSIIHSVEADGPPTSMYQPSCITVPCSHNEITQDRLDIMVRRLKLSQRQSILLTKELKQANILAPGVQIYGAINRHRRFTTFFKSIENNSIAYCTDIRGLVLTMQNEYNPGDWRLFIDSSKSSLKAVLLHVTNLKSPIPIALSTNTKETYASYHNVFYFTGILNGPDIRRLMKDHQFEVALNDIELLAWNCVKSVIENVLGNHRSENWRILIKNMLTAFKNLNVKMSLKIHFLHYHAEKFNEQSPAESDEHGERFHQVTARLEHWYSGKQLDSLLGDICWNLQEEEE